MWHYKLLPYLPDKQFRGQLRELIIIMRDWRDKGKTNHILINRVTDYEKYELYNYYIIYKGEYLKRYNKSVKRSISEEFSDFCNDKKYVDFLFTGWHDDTYLRICMANLYEKHLGIGKSAITDEEWEKLKDGYFKITKEYYTI